MKPNLDVSTFSVNHAGAIIVNWQRSFTDRLYSHPLNNNQQRKNLEISIHESNLKTFTGKKNGLVSFLNVFFVNYKLFL